MDIINKAAPARGGAGAGAASMKLSGRLAGLGLGRLLGGEGLCLVNADLGHALGREVHARDSVIGAGRLEILADDLADTSTFRLVGTRSGELLIEHDGLTGLELAEQLDKLGIGLDGTTTRRLGHFGNSDHACHSGMLLTGEVLGFPPDKDQYSRWGWPMQLRTVKTGMQS